MTTEGFIINLANTLGLGLGVKRRKNVNAFWRTGDNQNNTNSFFDSLNQTSKDFVNNIIDITRDDLCIGESPFFYSTKKKRLGKNLRDKIDNITYELNTISGWTATKLLRDGLAVYTYHVTVTSEAVDSKFEEQSRFMTINPVTTSVTVYVDYRKRLHVYNEAGVEMINTLTFIYYEPDNLTLVTDGPGKGMYLVSPVGLQLKNAKSSLEALAKTEEAIQKLRNQMRYIRFATVEVGVNSGDKQQEIVDDVSEGINSNSVDLTSSTSFDDQIPVFPTRKGLGAPTLVEFAPSQDIGNLTDLDYALSKAFMALRFPKTYADFSANLGQTAASMIRGDIRYSKLLERGRSLMERTVNDWISSIPILREVGLSFRLATIPTVEGDDVCASLLSYTDFTNSALDMILNSESRVEALGKLDALRALYSDQTNLRSVERWLDIMINIVNARFAEVGGASESVDNERDMSNLNGVPVHPDASDDLSSASDSGQDSDVEVINQELPM